MTETVKISIKFALALFKNKTETINTLNQLRYKLPISLVKNCHQHMIPNDIRKLMNNIFCTDQK
jgi:hypothetical protein